MFCVTVAVMVVVGVCAIEHVVVEVVVRNRFLGLKVPCATWYDNTSSKFSKIDHCSAAMLNIDVLSSCIARLLDSILLTLCFPLFIRNSLIDHTQGSIETRTQAGYV